ncbi:hypothetical protein [Sphingomonas jaspsi]|uniref:hypothetical protein n=1 Tax=Sphingomonas jaspsi TaxID=392409 RepID=UPI0004AF0C54|nr:hypothetical protein [Sphingomonas jaspsi]
MNTTLIPTLPIAKVASLAEWQAKQALRCGRAGDDAGFAIHANRMYDLLEAARYPVLTTQSLVRALGRSKAMVMKIERPIINLALETA